MLSVLGDGLAVSEKTLPPSPLQGPGRGAAWLINHAGLASSAQTAMGPPHLLWLPWGAATIQVPRDEYP